MKSRPIQFAGCLKQLLQKPARGAQVVCANLDLAQETRVEGVLWSKKGQLVGGNHMPDHESIENCCKLAAIEM